MTPPDKPSDADDFAAESARPRASLPAEIWHWMRHNKKWWLLPIVIALLLLGLLVLAGLAGMGPFIYPLA
jgi:hypothetical protein